MAMFTLFIVMFDSDLLILLLFAADIQECPKFYNSRYCKFYNKICTMVYVRKIPTYNIRSKILVLVTVCTYFGTDLNI